jgi:hypothetical protein
LLSCTGGLVGVVFFVKFSESVLKLYFRFFPFKPNTKKKKGFKRAFAIKVARKYGLFGIALITPIFLSIPLGTFLALHFFPDKKKTLPILFASVFGWSFILTLIWI